MRQSRVRAPSLLLFAASALWIGWLAGCNTVHGLGEDIQGAADSTRQILK